MAELLQRFGRWLRLKQYQLEVTFGVYIFTPTEKFVFWSVVFLLSALTFIATVLYLPQHIVFLAQRAWFYMHGDDGSSHHAMLAATKSAGSSIAATASSSLSGATGTAKRVLDEL